jgi:hypothetical protein
LKKDENHSRQNARAHSFGIFVRNRTSGWQNILGIHYTGESEQDSSQAVGTIRELTPPRAGSNIFFEARIKVGRDNEAFL